ncbi:MULTISPECIES: hypothetical protein [Rhizobium]|uniref:hypothetical protein n=1 Tax=Rhizobium TaxID=379 RepID=UPI00042026DE|nr:MULTISPECIES: hypothetical protein [Rhizobium]UFS81539.1 phage terminase large subunit family protein [Rhizobium sp. T136]
MTDEDFEAGEITREEGADALGFDLAEVDAENTRDQERLKVTGWTTLPEGFEVTAGEANETWPYDTREDDDPVTAGIDVQSNAGDVRVEITVNGQTASFTGERDTIIRMVETISNL